MDLSCLLVRLARYASLGDVEAFLRMPWSDRKEQAATFGDASCCSNTSTERVFEDNVRILENTTFSNVRVGRYSYVGGDSIIQNCTVGRFCSIVPDAHFRIGVHPTQNVVSMCSEFSPPAHATFDDATRIHLLKNISDHDR